MGLEQRGRWRWSLPVVDGLMGREELGVTRLEVSCGCGHAGTDFLGPRLSARHAGDDGEETVERLATRAAPDSRSHQKAEVPQPDFAPAGISGEGKGGDDPWSPIVRPGGARTPQCTDIASYLRMEIVLGSGEYLT